MSENTITCDEQVRFMDKVFKCYGIGILEDVPRGMQRCYTHATDEQRAVFNQNQDIKNKKSEEKADKDKVLKVIEM